MKIYCSAVNDMPIMKVLKEKFGIDFMFARDFNPTEHKVHEWHILRYINHQLALMKEGWIPINDFDGVNDMPIRETMRIQKLMIEKIKEL